MTAASRPLFCMAFGALLAAATLQLCTPHVPPVSPPETGDAATLFVPDSRDEGTICLPIMNRMRFPGCPQVLV